MYASSVERMPSSIRQHRAPVERRGKSSRAGRATSIARRQARTLKYGGQR